MKKLFFVTLIILLAASLAFGAPPSPPSSPGASISDTAGNGDATVTYSADKIFDLLALKQAVISAYTTITALWASGSCTGLLNSDGTCKAIGTDVQAYNQYYMKKSSAALTSGQATCTDENGDIISCGVRIVSSAATSGGPYLLGLTNENPAKLIELLLVGLSVTGTTTPTVTVVGLQNGTDPTVDAAGEVAVDTDGANITGDVSVRLYDGTNQVLLERKLKTIHVTVVKPQDLADAVRDAFPFWSNETGMTFTITSIKAWSGTDNATFMVEKSDADGANKADVAELDCTTDGTGVYTDTETTLTSATVTAGQLLWIDFDDSDDPAWVKVTIEGWFNADVD